jgi:hypothetical protein
VSSLGTHRVPRLSSSSSLFGVRYSLDPSRRRVLEVSCNSRGAASEEEDDGIEEVERALHLDGTIPGTSDEFVKRVSSRAYDMRRHLHQTFDSSSYDGIASNCCSLLLLSFNYSGFSSQRIVSLLFYCDLYDLDMHKNNFTIMA